MKTIHISASIEYDILIGAGLLPEVGQRIKDLGKVKTVVVVSDDNVFPLYGETVMKSLEAQGLRAEKFVFPHGEQSKCMDTYEELLEYLCEKRVTRSDLLVALGGGVVGDLTGFAAATYQRGIRFVQVPTTLLAAVDSSVGGKTAVNLKAAKNQVGCFYQPSFVLCDVDTLKTLPDGEFKCGCAEVIKYGVIGNSQFFDEIFEKPIADQIEHVIEVCVSAKRDVVMRDEFDHGDRMFLNFGHTFGHAAEKCSGYTLLHGLGVAIGMAVISKSAYRFGYCGPEVPETIEAILNKYDLPTTTDYSLQQMVDAAFSDKKLLGGSISLIVPQKIGKCIIENVPADTISDWMQAGGIK